ncbi:RluA family pseudouridine synthase [Peptoniphilus sp. GNH]|nr:RluA family pseudouridine synthase [Peptoniphilus sp. GNH]
MKEIIIDANEDGQRLDRFLRKYLEKAPLSFIYKNIRKKNISVNGKKAKAEDFLKEGDQIKLFIADETLEKFKKEQKDMTLGDFPNILYEDENLAIINKAAGILTHSSGDYDRNILDMFINYLIAKKEFIPRKSRTFRPAICNRLDRNTSGLLIGAKNARALREINKAIKSRDIKKYYLTLVKGRTDEVFSSHSFLLKDEKKNKVRVDFKSEDAKEAITNFKRISTSGDYSLLEVELITGRTHQIRTSLKDLGFPVIGDRKYGDPKENKKFPLKNQFLHSYKLVLNGFSDDLSYLNGKTFQAELPLEFKKVLEDLRL